MEWSMFRHKLALFIRYVWKHQRLRDVLKFNSDFDCDDDLVFRGVI
jgi:hypothetical protein